MTDEEARAALERLIEDRGEDYAGLSRLLGRNPAYIQQYTSHMAFDPAWLRRIARGAPDELSIIRVQGDSMTPTLADGDEILVDRADGSAQLRDGIYVLRLDQTLVVKRVALNPAGRGASIRSDNPAYPGWPDCDLRSLDIVGRVVWAGRRIG